VDNYVDNLWITFNETTKKSSRDDKKIVSRRQIYRFYLYIYMLYMFVNVTKKIENFSLALKIIFY